MASGVGKKNSITIKVDASKVIAKIKAMQDGTADMQPVFAAVGRAIKTKIDLCFKLGIDPWGSPWAALKVRKGGQPLRDRNRTGLSKIIMKADSTGVTIGTAAQRKIAATHQYGAVIKPKEFAGPVQPGKGIGAGARLVFPGPNGKMIFAKKVTIPARPFLPLRKGDVVALPPSWSVSVTRALRTYFLNEAKKESA